MLCPLELNYYSQERKPFYREFHDARRPFSSLDEMLFQDSPPSLAGNVFWDLLPSCEGTEMSL